MEMLTKHQIAVKIRPHGLFGSIGKGAGLDTSQILQQGVMICETEVNPI